MELKNILIHADGTDSFGPRLDYAITLAQAYDAHLTALYIIPNYPIPIYANAHIDPSVLQVISDQEKSKAVDTQSKFEAMTSKQGCIAEWRIQEGDAVNFLNVHGRYFDLTILGQADPEWTTQNLIEIADNLVVSLGRPCLVIPYIGALAKVPKRILVAWNGSQSAARAINDAMPLLKNADLVEVMYIGSDKLGFDEIDVQAADICVHLARHGVNAEAKGTFVKDISKGELILSKANEMTADLIVIGAYGHSRFRELVLGGVTRHLLRHLEIPVLMSH